MNNWAVDYENFIFLGGLFVSSFRTLLIGVGLLAAGIASANAADIYDEGKPYDDGASYDYGVPAIGWTGFFIGGHIGSATIDNSVGAYGVHAGYNWQTSPNYVIGIEGNYTDLNATDVGSLASIRGKLGYTTGNSLIYATAGLGRLDFDDSVSDDSVTGFVAGVGFDYKFGPSWSLGADMSYYAFDDEEDLSADDDLDAFTVTGRVTFHLGAGDRGGYK